MSDMSDNQGGYIPPTPKEMRDILKRMRLTGDQAGKLIGSTGRQIRQYTGGALNRKGEVISMPFPKLYLLVSRITGATITETGWRSQIWTNILKEID